ncbi:class II fructose-bisphosphate aldolase [Bosea sp. (in: a-proteobacteria)]|uniref:class II fructose-bisphosphate aldolase n=1 Tax=Bosea sp. (in: a-proteobacteria) TaxID=1871050 RepID=UPI002FCBB704
MACSSLSELLADLKTIKVDLSGPSPDFSKSQRPPDEMIDRWAETAAIAEPETRAVAIWAIREAALAAGIVPSSVQELYLACAAGKWSGKTVPAMNLRGWTYHTCRAVFRAAKELDSKLFIFEQAVGEALYAQQPPLEYTAGVLAAALREGHTGPVFLQADHDQINAKAYLADPKAEVRKLENIMREQVAAGLYSIDIDASTVVDLSLPTVEDQQRVNAELTAHFTEFVRGIEPEGITISLGAEIGEVGHENTTPEELRCFMKVYLDEMAKRAADLPIVSKISINSGTYHGGKVLPDGTLAAVNVDYELLKTISTICRSEFNMAGAVQHGASTLPGEQLAKFPAAEAVEIHLALGFNNLIFDHPSLPQAMRDQIREYTFANHASERAPGETDAQFFYNTRKKSWKVMKKPFWEMPAQAQAEIMQSLQDMFRNMFTWMNVGNTSKLVLDNTTVVKVTPPVPEALRKARAA